MKSVVIQKVVILNSDGNVLLLQRSDTDVRRPLEWDLPGGWLEENESFESGIKREVVEETGLTIDTPKLVFSKTEVRTWQEGDDAQKSGNCVFLFYIARAKNTDVSLSYEHIAYQWQPIKEAIKHYKYPLHIEALTYISQNLLADALA